MMMGGDLEACGRDLVSLNLALMLDADHVARDSVALIGEHASFTPGSKLLALDVFESGAAEQLPALEHLITPQLILPAPASRYDTFVDFRPLISVLSYPFAVVAPLLPEQLFADIVATVADECGIWLEDSWEMLERLIRNAPDVPVIQLLELAAWHRNES
jgi:hypothetical protein